MKERVTVAIAEDLEIVRLGIRMALENRKPITVVAEGAGGGDAIRLAEQYRPDVLLLGLNGESGKSYPPSPALPARSIIQQVARNYKISVLIVSRHDHIGLVRTFLDAGASGFLRWDEALSSTDELIKVILALTSQGRMTLSRTAFEKLQPHGLKIADIPGLTERKIEIMQTVVDNSQATIPEIADLLGIAESTLRNNLSSIFRTLGVPNLCGAVLECLRLGLVDI